MNYWVYHLGRLTQGTQLARGLFPSPRVADNGLDWGHHRVGTFGRVKNKGNLLAVTYSQTFQNLSGNTEATPTRNRGDYSSMRVLRRRSTASGHGLSWRFAGLYPYGSTGLQARDAIRHLGVQVLYRPLTPWCRRADPAGVRPGNGHGRARKRFLERHRGNRRPRGCRKCGECAAQRDSRESEPNPGRTGDRPSRDCRGPERRPPRHP